MAELKKKIGTLEEKRRNQTEESKKLQNEAERESKKDRELLHEKNNTLNREITRLTAMLSQNIGQENNAQVDNSVLERMTAMETELNEVWNFITKLDY